MLVRFRMPGTHENHEQRDCTRSSQRLCWEAAKPQTQSHHCSFYGDYMHGYSKLEKALPKRLPPYFPTGPRVLFIKHQKVRRHASSLAKEYFAEKQPEKFAAATPHWLQNTLQKIRPKNSPPRFPRGPSEVYNNYMQKASHYAYPRAPEYFAKTQPENVVATPLR